MVALYGASTFLDLSDFAAPRRPVPPPGEGGTLWVDATPAPAPSGRTPGEPTMDTIVEGSGADGEDVIGTAFLVAPDLWVTAAHVIEECTAGYIRIQGRWRKVTEARKHE